MAKHEVRVLTLHSVSDDETKPAFTATGTIDGAEFFSQTILWGPKGAKEAIFKVVEGDLVAQSLATSEFSRGQRIAIARACKMVRIGKAELFKADAEDAEADSKEEVEVESGS